MLLLGAPDLPTAAFLSMVRSKNDVEKHKISKSRPTLGTTFEALDLTISDGRAVPSYPTSILFFSFCHLQSRLLTKVQEDGSKLEDLSLIPRIHMLEGDNS